MEEYRAQFASQAAARAGSAYREEAPGLARSGVVEADTEADTAAVAEESRGVDQGDRLKPGLQLRGPLRKNRRALTSAAGSSRDSNFGGHCTPCVALRTVRSPP